MSMRTDENGLEKYVNEANPPIKTQAGQSVQEMSAQLVEAYKDSKLMANVASKEISEQMRQERISASVEQKRQMMMRLAERGKVDLTNFEEVQYEVEAYLESSKLAGVLPNFLGLSAAFGYTRRNLSKLIEPGKTINNRMITREVSDYLHAVRTAFAATMAEASLNRFVSEPTAIFLLKNTEQGLTDRQEVTLQTSDPFDESKTAAEIKEQYKDIIIE